MRIASRATGTIASSSTIGEDADDKHANGGRARSRSESTRQAAATNECHPNGDTSLRRTEAELHVLHSNLQKMERFMRDHPAQAASVRAQYESQRSLYNPIHTAYRQRTGHDFDPRCAGGTVDTRARPWSPPQIQKPRRDYVI